MEHVARRLLKGHEDSIFPSLQQHKNSVPSNKFSWLNGTAKRKSSQEINLITAHRIPIHQFLFSGKIK